MPNEPFTAHFWSLAVEVQFYLIFPALLLANVNRYAIIALIIVVGVTVLSFCSEHLSGDHYAVVSWLVKLSRYMFWKGPVIILIGSLLSIFIFKGIVPVPEASKGNLVIVVLLFAALVITSRMFNYYTRYLSEFTVVVLFAGAILSSLKSRSFLSSALLTKVGLISYSIYIWQELFIGTRVWQPWLGFMSDFPIRVIFMVKMALVLLISTLSYYFIERVNLRIKRKFE